MKSIIWILPFFLLSSSVGVGVLANNPQRKGKDFALFFAVNEYDNIRDLNNPIRNAKDIASVLAREYGFQTEVISNPRLYDIEKKLNEYREKFANGQLPSDGQLFIFFSGHGQQEFNEGFFLPQDADPNRINLTALNYSYWRAYINSINCDHILVTIDACYSYYFDPEWDMRKGGHFARPGELSEGEKLIYIHEKTKSRLFFTSDGKGNQTPDRSSFAKLLQEGLLASRGRGSDGIITSSDIFASLERAIPIPHRGEFGDDEPGSNFLFFRKEDDAFSLTKYDLESWNEAQKLNTIEAYNSYIKNYPNGDFFKVAKRKIQLIEQKVETQAWEVAKSANSIDLYKSYLVKYPKGLYAELARKQVSRLLDSQSESPKTNLKYLAPSTSTILIPGGGYQMGNQNGYEDEAPVHQVTLSSFFIGVSEITIEEYCIFLNSEGNLEEGGTTWYNLEDSSIYLQNAIFLPKEGCEKFPVINVSWYGARAYCRWLSSKTGERYRLPTEAEWEYAASGGPTGVMNFAGTDSSSSLKRYAVFLSSNVSPIKSRLPNSLGLYDMSGNVYEWCSDWYSQDYYSNTVQNNPLGPSRGKSRVLRGGSWSRFDSNCKVTTRHKDHPSKRSKEYGFRIVKNID